MKRVYSEQACIYLKKFGAAVVVMAFDEKGQAEPISMRRIESVKDLSNAMT